MKNLSQKILDDANIISKSSRKGQGEYIIISSRNMGLTYMMNKIETEKLKLIQIEKRKDKLLKIKNIMGKKRDITIDNVVEFLILNRFDMDYLERARNRGNYLYGFGLSDFNKIGIEFIKYFFNDYKVNDGFIDHDNDLIIGSFCKLEEHNREKMFYNFNLIGFTNLYPNLTIKLHEEGKLQYSIEEFGVLYKLIVQNKDIILSHPNMIEPDKYLLRLMINYLYLSSTRNTTDIRVNDINLIVDHSREFLINFSDKFNNNVIYIDTDS